jgi:hypothetical protein
VAAAGRYRQRSAWANLHEVEVRLVDLRPDDELEILVAEALQHAADLKKGDARVKELEEARKSPRDRDRLRAAVRSVLRASHEASDRDFQDARAFRDRLARVTLGLVGVVAVVIVTQALIKTAFLPHAGDVHMGRVPLLIVVMLFGSIGALISGVPALARTPRDRSPFHVPTHQMLLKLVLGALTAVLGVALAANGAAANGLGSMQGYIALAAAFGAGQHLVTKAVDDKAGIILAKQE